MPFQQVDDAYKEVLNERLENIRLQLGRIISDFNSEKDVRVANSKRLDDAIKRIDELIMYKNFDHEKLEKHERILFNDGKGLIFKIDRIDRALESKKDIFRFWIQLFVSIGAIIISLIAIFKQ